MKEKRADAARGTGYAILLHALLIGLLLFGLHRVSQQGGEAGGDGALQASVGSVDDLSAKTRRALLGAPKEATQPEPPVQEQLPELPKPVEAPAEPTPQPVAKPTPAVKETPPPKPEPQRPQPPVKTPPPKPEPAPVDASKKVPRPEPAKPVPDRKAEAAIAAQAAAEAARLAKASTMAKQRAEQLADARAAKSGRDASSSAGRTGAGQGSGQDNSGRDKWKAAVARAIEAKWVRPDDIPRGQVCPIRIHIIPGGDVISAAVQPGCPYSEEAKRSVEKAVRDASPLPFKGYDDVYMRDFVVGFSPSH